MRPTLHSVESASSPETLVPALQQVSALLIRGTRAGLGATSFLSAACRVQVHAPELPIPINSAAFTGHMGVCSAGDGAARLNLQEARRWGISSGNTEVEPTS